MIEFYLITATLRVGRSYVLGGHALTGDLS
jgi:hypothetical protein